MATPAPILHKQRAVTRIALRIVLSIVLLLALAVAGLLGWFYWRAKSALPQLDGTIAVAGLSAPVEVVRDSIGVPHISAANIEDLLFTQGYVTAQDRLWQMDMTRRYAGGELAEVLGIVAVESDRQQRTLSLRQAAETAVRALSARDRIHFQAYARGVNAFIEQHKNNLPIEFSVLRYSPRPWTAVDSFVVGASMHQMLSSSYESDLRREKVTNKLGPELAADLYITSSWRDHWPGKTSSTTEGEVRDDDAQPAPSNEEKAARPPLSAASAEESCIECRAGSNNWVVGGALTASGKPLLSNDMHLPLQIPDTWYMVHLRSGDFDVRGFSLPGLPYVIVGNNRRIAWGMTNLGPDVQDLFVEEFNAHGEYATPGGWQKPERRPETIKVKSGRDVQFEVIATRHGPIITGLVPGEKRQLALKWTLLNPRDMSIPFFEVNSARNWQDFRAAFATFGGPSQNVVYGDVDGNIGYQAVGHVPIRESGDGAMPVPGNTDAREWKRYVPFDRLPSVYNPASGVLATANSRITPDNYPYLLANEWASPYRVERIYKALSAKGKKLRPSDMLTLQTDVVSEFDRFLAERLVYAVDHTSHAPERVKLAAGFLRGFDGRIVHNSTAATLVAMTRTHLMRILLAEHGVDAKDYRWFMSASALERLLTLQPQRWLTPKYKSWDELLVAALEASVTDAKAPDKLRSWNYGAQYPIELNHLLFGRFPIIRNWAGPVSRPGNGNGNTVRASGRTFGASERMTVNFADLDQSTFNLVAGQSGQLFSDYYMDQFDAWYEGRTYPVPFSEAAVRTEKRHELRLEPK